MMLTVTPTPKINLFLQICSLLGFSPGTLLSHLPPLSYQTLLPCLHPSKVSHTQPSNYAPSPFPSYDASDNMPSSASPAPPQTGRLHPNGGLSAALRMSLRYFGSGRVLLLRGEPGTAVSRGGMRGRGRSLQRK
ncbi:hypothetical protein BDQ12DRAFT_685333 [Crucibulum laeve]|uniref:Uncharacterized protein n=1 Tax=Crucibulum laeve TaxID=68775 RepID=A0A5C3LZC7_9AGAR|nr:hypothetical protein BDQ12DRAFT_685333 [Crucibulum laeve]